MALIVDFRSGIAKMLSKKNLTVELWRGTPRSSSNLLEISTKPIATVLYVKVKNRDPGFWGLTANQLDRLDQSKIRWLTVLLVRNYDTGYVFSGQEVKQRIEDGTFKLGRDGDYKVNQTTHCGSNQAFRGLSELIARIL